MFLNSTPRQYTPRAIFGPDRASLTDNDVNYYGFLQSKEYDEVYEAVLMQPVQSMDVYDSPYFGQGSGAYRELDKVYEAYRQRFVGLDDIRQPVTVVSELKRTDASAGISPALILAAAAAFFFAG
jgi:hypothetical protein